MNLRTARAFTFIEISVVVFLIILLSFLVLPSIVAAQRSQRAVNFRLELSNLMQEARRQALQQNRATVVRFASDGRLGWTFLDPRPDGAQEPQNPGEDIQDGLRGLLSPAERTSFAAYRVGRADTNQSDWEAAFYPNGSSDRASLEFEQDGQAWTLTIDPDQGTAAVVRGTLQDIEENTWPAGEVERRVG